MNTQMPTSEIKEKNLRRLKLIWWVFLWIYGSFLMLNFWYVRININNFYFDNPRNLPEYSLFNAIGGYVFILSYLGVFIVAIFIYWKQKNDRMAILTSLMIISDLGKDSWVFWSSLYKYGLTNHFFTPQDQLYFYYAEEFFFFLSASLTYYVILNFPTGKWIFKYAWLMLVIWTISFSLSNIFEFDNLIVYFTILVLVSGMQSVKYLKTNVPIQRQQIKWILLFFIAEELVNLALITINKWIILIVPITTIRIYYFTLGSLDIVSHILYFGIAIAFIISIFRYRLWDIEIFINRAVVYSMLTGLLGVLGAVSLAVINYFIKQWFREDSSVWAVVISVLPVGAAFYPLRDRVQEVVDRYFKPEEASFENHFLEFRADIRDMLGTSRLIGIVSKQVKKQLDVESASVYLVDEDNKIPSLTTSEETLKTLINGELVVREDNADYSLLIPLVVNRPVIPDFIGIILLGRRLNGRGYSTPMLDSLKLLGVNAGEAIYLSQLKEQAKIKITTPHHE